MRALTHLLLPLALVLAACGDSSGPTGPGAPPPPPSNPSAFTQLAVGNNQTCAINGTGKAYCWGSNSGGESGLGEGLPYALTPTPVAGGRSYTQISAGSRHVCALDAAGSAWCWGYNSWGNAGGAPGTGPFFTPTQVQGGHLFAEIKAGGNTTCGRTAAGAAWCWGRGSNGQLGNGTTTDSHLPVQVAGGLSFAKLGLGGVHGCGITTAGDAYCWGRNSAGEIGDGTSNANISSPVAVSGGLKFASIDGGQAHTCAMTAAGKVYCWGDNSFGGLGEGTQTSRLAPTLVSGNHTFARIDVSSYQSCGIVGSSTAYCWGANSTGVLGDGSTTHRPVPVLVAGGHGFVSVVSATEHACGITTAGEAWCWGLNGEGKLGIGAFDTDFQVRTSPVKVSPAN